VEEDEPRFLEVSLKFDDKAGKEAGQDVFHGVSHLGNIKNLCVGQGKRAVKNVSVRIGKGLKPSCPTFYNPRVGRLGFPKKGQFVIRLYISHTRSTTLSGTETEGQVYKDSKLPSQIASQG